MADYLSIDIERFREIFLNEIGLHERGEMLEEDWLLLLAEHSPRNDIDMEEFTLFYEETYYDAATLNLEMFEMLHEIKPYIGWTAVLSNINPVAVDIVRRKFPGFFHSFRWHFFSCEMGHVKPEFPIYRMMLRQMNVAPKDVIFVDDRRENIGTARQLMMHTIHFDRDVEDIVPKTRAKLLRFFKD
jgi:HAD superfamily hydrolase (TIGR01509 family)